MCSPFMFIHVYLVCINVRVEVLVQLLCRTIANVFDFQETSASRPLLVFDPSRGFLRQ